MTKHLIALVRMAGRSYRILVTLTEFTERFPLDRFITAVELFIQWVERQEPPTGAQTPAGARSNVENRLFQTFADLQRQQIAAQETTNAQLSLIAATPNPWLGRRCSPNAKSISRRLSTSSVSANVRMTGGKPMES